MMNCCCCESQQEAWIREAAEGKPNRFRKDISDERARK